MRLLILLISFLISQIGNGQIINASPPYRVRATAAACSYVLDTYTGAAAGYSMKLIRSAYAGACLRIRRSSDNTESDINFSGGYLDTAAMKTFVGTGGTDDGFVVTWYDQSGSSSNMSQTSAAAQPKVMDNGVVLRNANGYVGIYYPGTSGISMDNTTVDGNAVLDIYIVSDMTDNTYMHFWGNAGGSYSFVADNGSGSTNLYGNFGTPALYTNNSLFGGTTRGQVYTAMNGVKIITMQSAVTTVWSVFKMGNYGSFEQTGYYTELIMWTSSQSANRSGITSCINTSWGVY